MLVDIIALICVILANEFMNENIFETLLLRIAAFAV